MASEQVGEAHVDIHVNASPAEAELDAFMAKSDRDFAEFGRKKAEATLGLKSADFDKQIDDAKAKLDYLKGRRATATLDLAKKHFDEEVAAAKAQLDALSKKKATITVETKQVKAAHKELSLLGKEQELNEKRSIGQAKAEQKLSQERSKATTEAFKQRAELARLSDEYERLKGKQEKLEKSSRGVFSPHSVAAAEKERRAISRVGDELEFTKHKIESMGGSVEGLDSNVSKNSSLLDKWASRLGDTSVRVGPLTASIKGLATGVGLLGPLLFELAGGALDVIGFLGAGIAGASAVGAAGLAGFATSAVGVGLVIKPMVKEFEAAKKASEALAKAELKYGANSSQVKTAQEQLNHTLKGVSPIAKEAFESYGKLGGEWRKLTSAAKPAVFEAFGQGLKTVQALLPEFASESTKTTQVAARAWDGWMKSLRSSGAKQALGEIMSNFRASIPGIASGLSSIGAMLGHIAAAASHFLPGLSHGFADWAANLEKSVGSGKGLQSSIGGLVHDMQDFGHLAQASGSFLVHFFGDAAESGDELNNSLTNVIKSWDRGIQTPQGKESLTNYFHESAEATKDFFSVIGGAAKLLFEFSQATAPVANGLLHIVTFLGNIVSAADRIAGIKTVFQALGGVLAGLWVVGKVQGYMGAIQGVLVKLGLLSGAAEADAAATDNLTAAIDANTAALEANAAAAADVAGAQGLAAVGTEADAAGTALAGAGEEAAGFSALLAPEVLIPVAALGGLALLATQLNGTGGAFEEARGHAEETSKTFQQSGEHFTSTSKEVNDAYQRQEKANNALQKAEEKTVKGIEKHGVGTKETAANLKAQAAAETQALNAQRASFAAAKNDVIAAKARAKATVENVKALQEEQHAAQAKVGAHAAGRAGFVPGVPDSHEAEHVAEAVKRIAAAQREVAVASRQMAVANIVNERQEKGLNTLRDNTVSGLHKLSTSIGLAATKKIGNFVDPGQVSKITNLSNKLTKLGQGATVKKIAVKSTGADQTEAKLKRLNRQSEQVSGGVTKLTVKTNDTSAKQSLQRLAQQSQAINGSQSTLKILANASSAEQAIHQLRAQLLQTVNRTYKAELKAEDKSGQAASNFHHNLQGVASKKYNAQITAIDNASPKALAAKGKLDAVPKSIQAAINVTSNASQVASAAHAAMEIPDTYATIHVSKSGPGAYSGGVMAFAGGGSPSFIQKASERAEMQALKNSTYGALINKPTFLTGEEGATHPEYVIATNPAYRSSNENYLEAAAGALGRELVPAFKSGGKHDGDGGGKKKSSSGGSKGGSGGGGNGGGGGGGKSAADAQKEQEDKENAWVEHELHLKPHEPNPKASKYLKLNKYEAAAVKKVNEKETDIQHLEHSYTARLGKEEQEIKAKQRKAWSFNFYKENLASRASDNREIKKYDTNIIRRTEEVIGNTTEKLNGTLSTGKVNAAEKQVNSIDAQIKAVKTTGLKGDAKTKAESKKRNLERQKTAAENHVNKLKKERENALTVREDAAAEKKEAEENRGEIDSSVEELQTELSEVSFIESHPEEAPYYESPEEQETAPVETQKEKEENYISERGHPNLEPAELALIEAENAGVNGQNLKPYEEGVLRAAEAEREAAKGTPGILSDDLEAAQQVRSAQQALEGTATNHAEEIVSSQSMAKNLYTAFAGNLAGLGAVSSQVGAMWGATNGGSPATPAYLPGTTTGTGNPGFTGSGSIGQSGPTTSNTIVNNFAAPPPDPHTWTAQQSFELGALA